MSSGSGTAAKMARNTTAGEADSPASKLDPAERRRDALDRRLAELVAQKDWRLVQTGRALHDDLGQLLTAAGIRFELLTGDLANLKSAPQGTDAFQEALDSAHSGAAELRTILEQSLERVRTMSGDLNRSTADRLGLKTALARLCEKWEPGFRGPITFHCPPRMQMPLGPSRVMIQMAEFGMELALNDMKCHKIDLDVKLAARKCVLEAHLWGLSHPYKDVENEARWLVLRAAAALAGGEVEIGVAITEEDVTIMRAQFPQTA